MYIGGAVTLVLNNLMYFFDLGEIVFAILFTRKSMYYTLVKCLDAVCHMESISNQNSV